MVLSLRECVLSALDPSVVVVVKYDSSIDLYIICTRCQNKKNSQQHLRTALQAQAVLRKRAWVAQFWAKSVGAVSPPWECQTPGVRARLKVPCS